MRGKSSFIRSLPKRVKEKMPYEEQRQREPPGSAFREPVKDTHILRLKYRCLKVKTFISNVL